MQPFHQLLSLIAFEFRSRIQLVFLIIPLAFLAHLQFKQETYRGLGSGMQQPIILFLFVMLAALLFAPQLASGLGNKAHVVSFSEFLFSRALDRKFCFGAKTICLIMVFLCPIILWSPLILAEPKLSISLLSSYNSPQAHETVARYQKVFPDTLVVYNKKGDRPEKLILPKGRMILLGWSLVWTTFLCLTSQWIVLLFSRWKYGKWMIWGGFALCMFAPLVLTTVFPSKHSILDNQWLEPLILGFYQQPALWIAALILYAFVVEKITLREFLKADTH